MYANVKQNTLIYFVTFKKSYCFLSEYINIVMNWKDYPAENKRPRHVRIKDQYLNIFSLKFGEATLRDSICSGEAKKKGGNT